MQIYIICIDVKIFPFSIYQMLSIIEWQTTHGVVGQLYTNTVYVQNTKTLQETKTATVCSLWRSLLSLRLPKWHTMRGTILIIYIIARTNNEGGVIKFAVSHGLLPLLPNSVILGSFLSLQETHPEW